MSSRRPVGSPFPNQKELLKIAEEFGGVVGGQENWLRIYHTAYQERYDLDRPVGGVFPAYIIINHVRILSGTGILLEEIQNYNVLRCQLAVATGRLTSHDPPHPLRGLPRSHLLHPPANAPAKASCLALPRNYAPSSATPRRAHAYIPRFAL